MPGSGCGAHRSQKEHVSSVMSPFWFSQWTWRSGVALFQVMLNLLTSLLRLVPAGGGESLGPIHAVGVDREPAGARS